MDSTTIVAASAAPAAEATGCTRRNSCENEIKIKNPVVPREGGIWFKYPHCGVQKCAICTFALHEGRPVVQLPTPDQIQKNPPSTETATDLLMVLQKLLNNNTVFVCARYECIQACQIDWIDKVYELCCALNFTTKRCLQGAPGRSFDEAALKVFRLLSCICLNKHFLRQNLCEWLNLDEPEERERAAQAFSALFPNPAADEFVELYKVLHCRDPRAWYLMCVIGKPHCYFPPDTNVHKLPHDMKNIIVMSRDVMHRLAANMPKTPFKDPATNEVVLEPVEDLSAHFEFERYTKPLADASRKLQKMLTKTDLTKLGPELRRLYGNELVNMLSAHIQIELPSAPA